MQPAGKLLSISANRGYKALQIGISVKTYSKFENGLSRMTLERLAGISQILEADPVELLSYYDQYNFYNYENSNYEIINQNNGCTNNERELYEKLIRQKELVISLLNEQ